MRLYLNELAPWERKNEYYHHIELGKNVNHQIITLRDAIKKNTKSQFDSANSIIASQKIINEGVDQLLSDNAQNFDRA